MVNVVILYLLRALVAQAAVESSPVGVDSSDVTRLTCTAASLNGTAPGVPSGSGSGGNGTSVASGASGCECPLLGMAWTFLWLIIFDVAFSVVVEPLVAVAHQRYRRAVAVRQHLSDYDTQLDFDVSDELVSVLYRQYLVLLGASVFPLITLLGLVAFAIEYAMDRVKLVTLCRKSLQQADALDLRLIVGCSLAVTLLSVVVYPQGLLFIAQGGNGGGPLSTCGFLAG
jgi:hypothetical protein